jgi:hypothetical protein
MQIPIRWTWDGQPLRPAAQLHWQLTWTREHLLVEVEAPYYADPPPAVPPGSCDGLWEFEVAELFLVGPEQRYLELELGPHGHYLLLPLEGVRKRAGPPQPLIYRAEIHGDRWRGSAQLPLRSLPEPIVSYNTFAIHSHPRVYLAHHPVGGDKPDFHRIDHFVRWPQ